MDGINSSSNDSHSSQSIFTKNAGNTTENFSRSDSNVSMILSTSSVQSSIEYEIKRSPGRLKKCKMILKSSKCSSKSNISYGNIISSARGTLSFIAKINQKVMFNVTKKDFSFSNLWEKAVIKKICGLFVFIEYEINQCRDSMWISSNNVTYFPSMKNIRNGFSRFSKCVSRILRHDAKKYKLHVRKDGYIMLKEILKHSCIKCILLVLKIS